MTMEITGSFSSHAAQSMAEGSAAGSTKKKEAEKTAQAPGSSKPGGSRTKSTAEYASELAKLVPSVEFRVGNSYSCAKSGKTLTVDPRILEKMQNDPKQEKETKELIRGVETANRLFDSLYQATGWTVVFRHSYIDENGKYRHIALIRNDFMLNMSEELREERRKNSEELIERTKEKATEKREELQEALEEKKTEKKDKQTEEAERLINEKMAASRDGMIYLYDTDIWAIIEAAKEDKEEKAGAREQPQAGANLDLRV